MAGVERVLTEVTPDILEMHSYEQWTAARMTQSGLVGRDLLTGVRTAFSPLRFALPLNITRMAFISQYRHHHKHNRQHLLLCADQQKPRKGEDARLRRTGSEHVTIMQRLPGSIPSVQRHNRHIVDVDAPRPHVDDFVGQVRISYPSLLSIAQKNFSYSSIHPSQTFFRYPSFPGHSYPK
ncbi:hypothetical protein D0861_06650 [Hortaea werneckii]|uniref:Uncharacterized protein n=1 Tax=Hortaea werneckii TaxID=91943 RepID=A0A3M7F8U9_HORWE|nr:hypothetical protein D0861_06650 [Hortaea werneckii]